jgi:polygalacturonase
MDTNRREWKGSVAQTSIKMRPETRGTRITHLTIKGISVPLEASGWLVLSAFTRETNMRRYGVVVVMAGLWTAAVAFNPGCAAEATFSVADRGATGDGKTVCTAAIQKTIDAAADAGGGAVVFPKGTYLTAALFVKSNVELRLDEGVVLQAVQDDAAYPEIPTRIAGVEMIWPAAVINVNGQRNVKITGKGVLDGNGEFWWRKFAEMRRDYEQRGLRWAVDYDCKRVRALLVYNSQDVTVSGITIQRSGFWTLTMTYSQRVTVDGVTIRANIGGRGPSSDGIDIDSSRDILIQNCDIDCNDDNICLKAGRDADGLRVNRPTENVVIRDCITRAGQGVVTIGSETSGGIRNVEASRLKAIGTINGIRFKSAKVRGGLIENIRIHDIEMDGTANPFQFELNWYPSYSYPVIPTNIPPAQIPDRWRVLTQRVEPAERGIPEFRDITIANVTAKGATQAFHVNAFAEKPMRNVRWSNITIDAQKAGTIKNAADWTMSNVVVRAADGKPVVLSGCSNVPVPAAGER